MDLSERRMGHYGEAESLTPERRERYVWARLEKLVETAWEHSAEFRDRMDKAGLTLSDIGSLDAWSRIPVLRKKELLDIQTQGPNLGGLLTCELGELKRIYQSPGPIFDPESRQADYWGWAEGFYAAGFRPRDIAQMTFSYHLTPAGLMLEEPLREIGCAVIPAGPGNTDKQIELLTSLPVTGFVGMASYLRIIADKAQATGLDLKKDFKLTTAFVAAERLPESLRQGLEEDFGMIVRQGYGTADLGCVAYECPELGGMHVSGRCHVEICDPETHEPLPMGQTGEVVVTPFTDAYPLIRFATGDLSYFVDEPCACGRTAYKLGAIVGRVDDTAKVKGQFVYPAQVGEVCASFEVIKRWQVVVQNPDNRDRLVLRVQTSGDLDLDAFIPAFQAKIKLRPEVEVVPDGGIAQGAAALVDARIFE